jgi:O-antigen/teichoic acid export membrane protein
VDNIKSRLAAGTAWIGGGRILVNILAFAGTLLLARLLTPQDFGLVAIATTLLAIVTSATEMSLSSALLRLDDPTPAHFDSAFTLNMIRATAIAIAFVLGGFPLAAAFNDDRLVGIMAVLGAAMLVTGMVNPRLVLLNKQLQFRQDFIIPVTNKLVGFVITVAIALIWRSYWALIVGAVVGPIVRVGMSYMFMPYRPRFGWRYARELWSFSSWLMLGQVAQAVNAKLENLLVGAFLGRTPLGFYTVGDSLANMPTRETTLPLSQTMFAGFALFRDDIPRLRNAYQSAQSSMAALVLPAGVGFALLAEPLVPLAMGEKWVPVIFVIQVLASFIAVQTLSSAVQPLAMALGATRGLFVRDVVTMVARAPLLVAGLIVGGFAGIVWMRAFTGLVITAINMAFARRLLGLGFRRQLGVNLPTLIAVTVMAAAVLAVQHALPDARDHVSLAIEAALSIVVGALVYLLARALIWLASGRPAGPETHAIDLARRFLAR